MTRLGRSAIHRFVGVLEMVGIALGGTQKTTDSLALAADNLVRRGKIEAVYADVLDGCEEARVKSLKDEPEVLHSITLVF